MATRKKHTPEQVVRKLATADRMLNEGKVVADVCGDQRLEAGLQPPPTAQRPQLPVGRLVRHRRHVLGVGSAVSYCGRPVGR